MSTVIESSAMETREAPPSHLMVKIESFSLLHKCGVDKYETKEFDAGKYKWRLIIYPKGHGTEKDGEYVSVYVAISGTTSLPENWEVNAIFSIFILNQISGNYLYTKGKTQRFFAMKTEWGFPKFISKKDLTAPSNGYLIDDSCVIGAEVFVIENKNVKIVTESLSLKNVTVPDKQVLKISNFSKLEDVCYSEEFIAGGHKWKIELYPKGSGNGAGRSLSIFLMYVASDIKKASGERVKANYSICIKNWLPSCNRRCETSCWFSVSRPRCGWPSFLSLDSVSGFLVKDCCIVEIEISVQAVAQ